MNIKDNLILGQYRSEKSRYEQLGKVVQKRLEDIAAESSVSVMTVGHRLKDEKSLCGKLYRKGEKYRSLEDITDILGARIVCYFYDDVDVLGKQVEKSFVVDWENSVDKRKQMRADSMSHKDAFAITFVNGLCNAEEALLSFFYSVIKNDNFMIAGGSAGDDLKFQKTFASYNGTIVSDGAVILFVKTPLPFFIQKENIFKPTGSRTKITQADTRIRKIISLDGMNPRTRYAQLLGIPESKAGDAALTNPFGRVFGGHTFISQSAGTSLSGHAHSAPFTYPPSTQALVPCCCCRWREW